MLWYDAFVLKNLAFPNELQTIALQPLARLCLQDKTKKLCESFLEADIPFHHPIPFRIRHPIPPVEKQHNIHPIHKWLPVYILLSVFK